MAFAVVVLVLRWDYARSQELAWRTVEIREARQEARCWRALAQHRPATREEVVPVSQRMAWVADCVQREITR